MILFLFCNWICFLRKDLMFDGWFELWFRNRNVEENKNDLKYLNNYLNRIFGIEINVCKLFFFIFCCFNFWGWINVDLKWKLMEDSRETLQY